MTDPLALRFVSTVRAERGGLKDSLATPAQAREWLAANVPGAEPVGHAELVALRQAVRALFARAVAPRPPSPADAAVLPDLDEALALVNSHAAPVRRQLAWTDGPHEAAGPAPRDARAVLAGSVIDFFTGPGLPELGVCRAPRCVLYFLKGHPKQEWCSVACGNRARAARHYAQHKGA